MRKDTKNSLIVCQSSVECILSCLRKGYFPGEKKELTVATVVIVYCISFEESKEVESYTPAKERIIPATYREEQNKNKRNTENSNSDENVTDTNDPLNDSIHLEIEIKQK